MKQGKFYQYPEKYKNSTIFACRIKPVVSEEKDKFLALASLENLKTFIPDIDISKNIDLLPFATDAFVANRVNANDDMVTTQKAIEIANLFKYKYLDIEHSRNNLIGVILTAGFSEFGSSKPLNLEDIKDKNIPFNVTLGGEMWRTINEKLTDFIEETNDPNSKYYMSVSSSWELAFSNNILILFSENDKNLEDGEIINDPAQISELEGKLRAYGGTGKTSDGKRIARIITDDVLPLGLGITETPAGDVKGILVQASKDEIDIEINKSNINNMDKNMKEKEEEKNKEKTTLASTCPNCGEDVDTEEDMEHEEMEKTCSKCGKSSPSKNWKKAKSKMNENEDKEMMDKKDMNKEEMDEKHNKEESASNLIDSMAKIDETCKKLTKTISQLTNHTVKNDSGIMKINDIKDITDENIKEAKASDIHQIVDKHLEKLAEDFTNKKNELSNTLQASEEKVKNLEESNKSLTEKFNELQAQFNNLIEANKIKEQEETFSARMEALDKKYNLTPEDRKILGEQIKNLDNEGYKSFASNLEILLKEKIKTEKQEIKASVNTEDKKEEKKEEPSTVIDKALDNSEKDKTTVAATTAAKTSLKDEMKAAFGIENWTVKRKR